MNQNNLHQSLSALMDGEAGELELQRLLKQSAGEQLRQNWLRWQIVRAALHGEAQSPAPLNVAARVAAALDAVPAAKPPRTIRPRWWARAGQLAVAASVTLAVLGGVRFYQSSQQAPSPPLQAQQGDAAPFNLPLAEPPQLAGFGSIGSQTAPPLMVERLDWQAERLPLYLHQHYQQGALSQGMGAALPYARAASFSDSH